MKIIWKEDLDLTGATFNLKENFCGACVALPLALAGAGTATATSGNTESGGKNKIFFWSVIISIVSLIATIYFLKKRNCETCFDPKKRQ